MIPLPEFFLFLQLISLSKDGKRKKHFPIFTYNMYHISANKKLHLHKTVSINDLQTLQQQHKDKPEDLFWAYRVLIFDKLPLPSNITHDLFWKKMTKPQQVIYTLGIFIEQTNNGGIWQFFFNQTEYICAVGEAFETFSNMNLFNTYYTRCFNELAEILQNGVFEQICEVWNNQALPFEERWKAFKSGQTHIPHHTEFETYFYSEEGKNRLYRDFVNKYIEQNLGAMIVVEDGKNTKSIDKKEAIPHFTAYLKQFYGNEPIEVSIYYSANVTIDSNGTKLFLMYFKMPDGYESLGITGHFTHHFTQINMDDVRKMYQKHHKQELINIYYGWYLIEKHKQNNASPDFDASDWELCLSKLQHPSKTQIPVNVKLKEALFYNNQWHYAYTGDLYYNDKPENFPQDLQNVPVLAVSDKNKGEYRGELNRLFSTIHVEKPSFGRTDTTPSVDTKCFFERWIGRQNKLVKDNPWGF